MHILNKIPFQMLNMFFNEDIFIINREIFLHQSLYLIILVIKQNITVRDICR